MGHEGIALLRRTRRTLLGDRAILVCATGIAALTLSACTSTNFDVFADVDATTPALNADGLATLGDGELLPSPTYRPGGADQASLAPPEAATSAFAGPTPTSGPVPAAEVSSTGLVEAATPAPQQQIEVAAASTTPQPATIGNDVATQRIRAAQNAPTATGNAGDATPTETIVAEVAPQPAPSIVAASQPRANRSGFLNALFGERRNGLRPPAAIVSASATSAPEPRPIIAEPTTPPRPVIARASASGGTALPGFSRERALGINTAPTETEGGLVDAPVQLASAAGLARLAPNGLRTQHAGVDVKCLKPALVRVLKRIERHYRKPVIITSGYRSPERNRRARGAKNSLHIYCAAADIQVPGVSKWDLAAYLRSVPGRGGVGTYCHTQSVHIDIGPERDWNWRCRRRR